ncbi:MAG: endonuclease/exonuclease/phosphatase family protein [Bacteroidales bacterium]|nr:endonuclease/exonuclease/phosphatase family protein [Bacteroidales bacterium]
MKHSRLIFFVFIFLLFSSWSCQKKEEASLNVMSYNLRYDNPDDSLNNWQYRKDFACKMLRFYSPDVLGTQEVLKNQLDDILLGLNGYKHIGVGRIDGVEKGEYAAILYKSDRLTVVRSGNFWLSPEPEKAGSKGWDAACERIVTWSVFKDNHSGKEFAFFNTHFDHVGDTARHESALLLKNRIAEIVADLPVIITGDLNSIPGDNAIKTIVSDNLYLDSRLIAPIVYGPEWTLHGFGKVPNAMRPRIDYVFVNKKLEVLNYASVSEMHDSVFLSDHNPVFVKLKIN